MGYRLKEAVDSQWLADELGLVHCGKNTRKVLNVASIANAENGSLIFSTNKAIIPDQKVILISNDECADHIYIRSVNPRLDFIKALKKIQETVGFDLTYEKPKIHSSVLIDKNVVIENGVEIGAGTKIESNTFIAAGTKIGKNCLIKANASIGSDGFGFERLPNGTPIKFIHLGGVTIGNNVEIGSNSCVAKGTLDNTIIGNDVKIDNLVQIAHNCKIGVATLIASNAAIGGSVKIGDNCWISTSACIKSGIRIHDNAFIGIGAVVIRTIRKDTAVFGNPAVRI